MHFPNKATSVFTRVFQVVLFLMSLFISLTARAQVVISGKVTDAATGDGVPFANVILKGTTTGTTTNFEGLYSLKSSTMGDSVIVSYLGYRNRAKAVDKTLPTQTINVQLETSSYQLSEVVVHVGENPAFRILREVTAHKPQNNKNKLTAYEYESYVKTEIDVDNLSEKLRSRKVIQKMTGVIESIQKVVGDDGKPILPVFISEAVSNVYHRRSPDKIKEFVRKSQVSGVGISDNSIVQQLIGSTFQEFNFYDNYLRLLGKDFISPIADGGRGSYLYFLADSGLVNNAWCYRIEFEPKRKADLAFTGTVWIDKKTYGLAQIDATIGNTANINFIEGVKIQQEFEFVDSTVWMPVRNRILIDIAQLSQNSAGMLAKFYTSNDHFVLNKPRELSFYDEPLVMADDVRETTSAYWQTARHDPLTLDEKNVYRMIDSVKTIPIVKTYSQLADIAINGYFKAGKIDIGPYLYTYARNSYEGNRFRLGARTNSDFSKWLTLKGYLAYGTRDSQFKYSVEAETVLSRKRWTTVGYRRTYDVQRLGVNPDAIGDTYLAGTLFRAFTSFGRFRQPYLQTEDFFYLNTELAPGFTQTVGFRNRRFEPQFPFAYVSAEPVTPDETNPLTGIYDTSELMYEFRYARGQRTLTNAHNRRVRLRRASAFPIISFKYVLGTKALGGDFTYHKFTLGLSNSVRIGVLGRLRTDLTAGYTPSVTPYPLLEVHQGNQSLLFVPGAYNLMNYFEFVSDKYVSLRFYHDFEGLLFNGMPLIRRLNWRAHVSGNVLWGSVRSENQTILPSENYLGQPVKQFGVLSFNRPYVEVGYGIDNIFKCMSIMALHRLTYRDNPNVQRFGVKINFQFKL